MQKRGSAIILAILMMSIILAMLLNVYYVVDIRLKNSIDSIQRSQKEELEFDKREIKQYISEELSFDEDDDGENETILYFNKSINLEEIEIDGIRKIRVVPG